MKNKFITLITIAFLLLVTGCQKEESINLDGELGSREAFCKQEEEKGVDLNLNGCFYNELENGVSTILFFPEGVLTASDNKEEGYLPWAHVISQNTFVTEENHNIDYLFEVLSNILFDNAKLTYAYADNSIQIELSPEFAYDFSEKYNLYFVDEEGVKTVDSPGMTQVFAQILADTIYSNFPEIDNVSYIIPGIDTITPATGDELINKDTLLPVYYGSENNFIGNISFQDYIQALEENGVKLKNYFEKDYLWVVNTYAYTAN